MVVCGALVPGLAGCVAGLVIGLFAYAPTAWFATFEVGIPAAMIGSILGLVVGSLIVAVRTIHRRLLRQAAIATEFSAARTRNRVPGAVHDGGHDSAMQRR
jgi:xanthosine utilization system XapX-like protein